MCELGAVWTRTERSRILGAEHRRPTAAREPLRGVLRAPADGLLAHLSLGARFGDRSVRPADREHRPQCRLLALARPVADRRRSRDLLRVQPRRWLPGLRVTARGGVRLVRTTGGSPGARNDRSRVAERVARRL